MGAGERNQGCALLKTTKMPETALYRAPTFSLPLTLFIHTQLCRGGGGGGGEGGARKEGGEEECRGERERGREGEEEEEEEEEEEK